MKWARNITCSLAIAALGLWFVSYAFFYFHFRYGHISANTIRPGLCICWNSGKKGHAGDFSIVAPSSSKHQRWWTLPSVSYLDGNTPIPFLPNPIGPRGASYSLYLPHWLTNLVAWSMFYVLWRRARRHPKGHCQTCGYDLTGNASGKCSECGKVNAAR